MAMYEGQGRNWHVSNVPTIALLLLLLLQLGTAPTRASFLWNITRRDICWDGNLMSKPYDSVTGIGDIDGNGFDDFAVGYAEGGPGSFGIVYVFFMGPGGTIMKCATLDGLNWCDGNCATGTGAKFGVSLGAAPGFTLGFTLQPNSMSLAVGYENIGVSHKPRTNEM